jgi:hypothetical protein
MDREGRRTFNEAMIASGQRGFRAFPTVPAAVHRVPITWKCGPGHGWGLRLKVRRVRRALEAQGFVVTTCVVGRRYRLVRSGLLPSEKQDRLGMAAVVIADRASAGDGSRR